MLRVEFKQIGVGYSNVNDYQLSPTPLIDVHLLLTPERLDSASLMMKHLGQRYVQYINRTYRRSGTLWEGRFKSCLAQHEQYVLTCYRYIELNPVRAKMVQHPCEYRWSGYHRNAEGKENKLIKPHEEYARLGATDEERKSTYQELLTEGLDSQQVEQVRTATNGNYVLGNDRFKEEIELALGRRVTPGKRGRPRRVD